MKSDQELCERVRIAAMAMADGEEPEIPFPELEKHLRSCRACRLEVAALGEGSALLAAARRRTMHADLWRVVREEMAAMPVPATGPVPPRSRLDPRGLLVAGALLACCKIAELGAPVDPAPLLRLLPLLVAAALFLYLKSNPFTIDSGLRLEGE